MEHWAVVARLPAARLRRSRKADCLGVEQASEQEQLQLAKLRFTVEKAPFWLKDVLGNVRLMPKIKRSFSMICVGIRGAAEGRRFSQPCP
jgi:hypothetical protein